MSSFSRLLKTAAFRRQPIATAWRCISWLAFHILPHRRATITLRAADIPFKLDLPPLQHAFGSAGIFVQREYYEPLLQFCGTLARPGDTVFDCGANQGIFTCAFAALVGASGLVISVEPQRYAIEALRNNVILNGFHHVRAEEAALSDRVGTARLDRSAGAVAASIVLNMGGTQTIEVPTTTLAALCDRYAITRIDLIKMDIEGAEYQALAAARDVLARFRPKLVLEGSLNIPNWGQLTQFMRENRYQPHLFDGKGKLVPIDAITKDEPNIIYLPH